MEKVLQPQGHVCVCSRARNLPFIFFLLWGRYVKWSVCWQEFNFYMSFLFLQEQNCCHDVTIVMFSRTFYDAQSRGKICAHHTSPYYINCQS